MTENGTAYTGGTARENTLNQGYSMPSVYKSNDPIVEISLQDKNSSWDLPNGIEHKSAPKHPTTYLETTLHLFKGNIGSGVYALGDAFKNGGIVFSPIATLILGIICVHSQHLLLTGSDEIQRKVGLSLAPGFAETVELCFSTGPQRLRKFSYFMKVLVNTCLCITQLGFCCVYFVFISTNLKKICDHYDFILDIHIFFVISLLPILLSCLIRNLKFLTPISTLANLLMAIGIGIIIYFVSFDIPPLSERTPIADISRLPLYFGTVIYAFEAIGLVLPLKNEMKNPHDFQKTFGVLNVGMTFVTILYVVVGFLGYAKWGETVEGSLTLNLPDDNKLSIVVQFLIAIGVLFSYPLQFYVPIDITWPSIRMKFGPFRKPVAMELLYRVFLVLFTFALATAIPHLGLFISLVGALSSTALGLIFPPTIELMLKCQNPGGISWFILLKNAIIILVAFIGFITGTFASVRDIIAAFNKDYFN